MIGNRNTNPRGTYGRYELGTYANPAYDVSSQFLPRNLHDLLKWTRFIIVKSPTTTEILRKMSTYPVTDVVIPSSKEHTKEGYDKITDSCRVIERVSDIGFDYNAFGNAFVSIYMPFDRMVECPSCKETTAARTALDTKLVAWKKFEFTGECRCGHSGKFNVKDIPSRDVERINIIKWKLDHMSVNENPISGDSEYYYSFPGEVKRRVTLGDPHYICTIPMEMIEAIRTQRDFKFAPGEIHHMKGLSMGDFLPGFGIPPLLSHYSTVFYMQCLRKANEAIALEHMNPMRMIFPQQSSPSGDPIAMMSMGNFTGNMKLNLQKFKQDPNHVLLSPVPIGTGYMGGQGKSLLVTQELQFAEEQLLMAQGVSRELLSGTTNWTSSTVGLRLLENNMNQYVRKLRRLTQWIYAKIASHLRLEVLDVEFVPFELTDNDNIKQLLLEMHQRNMIDSNTVLEAFDIDPDEVRSKIEKEAIQKAEDAVKLKQKIQEAEFLAQRDEVSDGTDDNGFTENRDEIIKLATKIANMTDPQEQRQALMQLQHDDEAKFNQVMLLLHGGGEEDGHVSGEGQQ